MKFFFRRLQIWGFTFSKIAESVLADDGITTAVFQNSTAYGISPMLPIIFSDPDPIPKNTSKDDLFFCEAFWIIDEPNYSQFQSIALVALKLKKRFPEKVLMCNLLPLYSGDNLIGIFDSPKNNQMLNGLTNINPLGSSLNNYIHYLREFLRITECDIISTDIYPFSSPVDYSEYFLNIYLISEVAKEFLVPFQIFIQVSSYLAGIKIPTIETIRYQVYASLVFGARHIGEFVYNSNNLIFSGLATGNNALDLPTQTGIKNINKEIRSLSPTLAIDWDHVATYSITPITGTRSINSMPTLNNLFRVISIVPCLVGIFARNGKSNGFMLFNPSYIQSTTINFEVAGNLFELDKSLATWVRIAKNSSYSIYLAPGEGRFLATW
jgi:hypothetical protein